MAVDPAQRAGAEQLGLSHELDAASNKGCSEEVIHIRGVVRRENHRSRRDIAAVDTLCTKRSQSMQYGDRANNFVGGSGRAAASAFVKCVEISLGRSSL